MLIVLCCCRGSWSVNMFMLAVGSYTMIEKMGLVLILATFSAGWVSFAPLSVVLLLQDHGCAS